MAMPQVPLDDLASHIGRETLRHLATSEPDLIVAAVEACPVNITFANINRPDMPLAYVNPAFAQTTGYAVDEVIGRNCRFLQGPDTDPKAVDALRDAIVTKSKVAVEFVNYRKDGTPFINDLKMAPVHDETGRLVSFVGIQSDVTEERARQASEISRQRIEALGQMAGGVAHQLNNLIQPIVTLVSLHRPEIDDPQIANDMETVLESARQAAGVVEDILTFSRHRAKKHDRVSVPETVRRHVHFIRTLLPRDVSVELTVGRGAEELHIEVDPTQLCQALANLMINASQAMSGEGLIDVRIDSDGGDMVRIAVEDGGPGIPPENRSRVLEPFFSTKTDDGGTGLGLSVVSGIVDAIGGRMSISDAVRRRSDRGCCITLSIPIAR